MKSSVYDRLVEALESVKRVMEAQAGEYTPADLRIRCLLNITVQESRRAQREVQAAESRSCTPLSTDDGQLSAATS